MEIMVVIGVCALMTPVVVDGASLKRDFPFSMICAILLLVMGTIGMTLGRVDGIILLGCFAGYIFYLIRHTLKQNRQSSDEEVDMALGNAVGSCIFNILMVLGIASAISPIAFIQENIIDIIVLVVFSLIVWIMAWTKREIKRGEGIIMLLMYAAYTAYIIIR